MEDVNRLTQPQFEERITLCHRLMVSIASRFQQCINLPQAICAFSQSKSRLLRNAFARFSYGTNHLYRLLAVLPSILVSTESNSSLGGLVMVYNYILKDTFGGRIDSNADVIYGKESNQSNGGNDVIKALGGHDAIYANGGNDIIDAGTGNDSINGGFGDDTF